MCFKLNFKLTRTRIGGCSAAVNSKQLESGNERIVYIITIIFRLTRVTVRNF